MDCWDQAHMTREYLVVSNNVTVRISLVEGKLLKKRGSETHKTTL